MAGVRRGVFVDSGGWIALFRSRDAHHEAADAMFRRAIADRIPLVTTNLIVAEVHRFVLHRVGIRPASIALERIATSRHLKLVFAAVEHHREATRWLSRLGDQVLSYTDATSFAVMKSERIETALTFDRHFTVAGFRAWSL
jgi:predicted nucleic acid-binding protein